jgi:hypothetical protein
VLGVVLGRLEARHRRCAALAGKSTLNRPEHGAAEADRYRRIAHHGAAIEALIVDLFLDARGVADQLHNRAQGMRKTAAAGQLEGWRRDAADAAGDQGADLQELQADRAAGGGGKLGAGEADAAQGGDQHEAMEANQSRSWLARMVAAPVRSPVFQRGLRRRSWAAPIQGRRIDSGNLSPVICHMSSEPWGGRWRD